jgi:hypothetical protein
MCQVGVHQVFAAAVWRAELTQVAADDNVLVCVLWLIEAAEQWLVRQALQAVVFSGVSEAPAIDASASLRPTSPFIENRALLDFTACSAPSVQSFPPLRCSGR